MSIVKIKIKKPLKNYAADTVLTIDLDKSLFWRRRLQDAKTDGSIEIIKGDAQENYIIETDVISDKKKPKESKKIQKKSTD